MRQRQPGNLSPQETKVVGQAKRSARSQSGKALLRRRGMHLERTFAHILDAGGARRTTLRGLANLNKRFKLAAAIYNLWQLMRELLGVGTPKQWAAGVKGLFWFWWSFCVAGWSPASGGKALLVGRLEPSPRKLWRLLERWVKDTAAAFAPILCHFP